MWEIAFKEWWDKKKQEDKHQKINEANRVLTFEEKKKLYRQKNIEKSKTRPYDGHIKNKKRVKSSKRKQSKKLIENI